MSQNDEPLAPESWPTDALRTDTRELIDEVGVRWTIYEQPTSFDRRRGSSLVFESETSIRRVRNYPDDWYSLDDAALLEVSWSR